MAAGPRVRIAPGKIERALLNPLTNAVRHTPSDGAISLVVKPNSDHVVVSVEDTGPGLEADATERMFERSWRADDSRARSGGGAGLGLAIAQGSSTRTGERSGPRTAGSAERGSPSRPR